MTPDEADSVLLQMSAVWWSSKLGTDTLKKWHNFLEEREAEICMDVVAQLAIDRARWPSFNEFWVAYQMKKRRQNESAANGGQLPGVKYLSKEENARRMKELRATLKPSEALP